MEAEGLRVTSAQLALSGAAALLAPWLSVDTEGQGTDIFNAAQIVV